MAGKSRQRLTQGLASFGVTNLRHFRSQLAKLAGDFSLSVAFNDGYYRILHGLSPEDVERMIISDDIDVLHIWAVFRD